MEDSTANLDLSTVFGFADDDMSLDLNSDFVSTTIEDMRSIGNLKTINENELKEVLGNSIYEENSSRLQYPTLGILSNVAIENSAATADVNYEDIEMDQHSQVAGTFQQDASFDFTEQENIVCVNNSYQTVENETKEVENDRTTEKVSSSTWYADLVSFIRESDDHNEEQFPPTVEGVPENYNTHTEQIQYAENGMITAVQVPVSVWIPNFVTNVREPELSNSVQIVETLSDQTMAAVTTNSAFNQFQQITTAPSNETLEALIPNSSINQFQTTTTLQGVQLSFQPIFYNQVPNSFVAEGPVTVPYRLGKRSIARSKEPSILKRKNNGAKALADRRCAIHTNAQMQIAKYRTVHETELEKFPENLRGKCMIVVPYAPYPYDPQLYLEYAGDGKFVYRFRTVEDPNTNKRFLCVQSSSCPKPPKFWCLVCGVSFTRSTSVHRHMKIMHNSSYPLIYKISYYVEIEP